MKVFKYPLALVDEQTIMMPGGESAKCLSVGVQRDGRFLWAEVETGEMLEPVRIRIAGTGQTIGHDGHREFIGTVHEETPNGAILVWHVYRVR